MAIILFVALGTSVFYQFFYSQTKDYMTLIIPVGFTLGMFAWWSYIANNFQDLTMFIKTNGFTNIVTDTSPTTVIVLPSFGELIFSTLGQTLFMTLSLIGIFYMISRKGNSSTFSIAIVSIILLCIPFGSILSRILLISGRFLYITGILLSIPLALALYSLGTWKIKKPIRQHYIFLGFIVTLTFLMLMSPAGNNDNYTFTPILGKPYYYTQSEMSGSDFFAEKSTGVLSSDRIYATNPSSSVFMHLYNINPQRLYSLDSEINSGEFNHDGSIKIFRWRYIKQYQMKGIYTSNIYPDLRTYISNSGFDKIYDNSVMTGYIG